MIEGNAEFSADNGRVVVDDQLQGSLWRGRQLQPRDRAVVVAIKDFGYATGKEIIDRWYRFDAPGIAPLSYLGYPDGLAPTADELRAMRKKGQTAVGLLAEVVPDGVPLAEAEQLTDAEIVRVGLGLCDSMIGWIAKRGSATVGMRPETVYVAGERGKRFFAGATPRVCLLLVGDEAFPTTYFGAPLAASSNQISSDDAAFVVGLLLWFAAMREPAYQSLQVIEYVRPEFTGNTELLALLNVALDLNKPSSVQLLRDGLEGLATKWKVERPPFPPPGLAE